MSRPRGPDAGGQAAAPLHPCDRVSEQVHLLVDHELGPAERSHVETHLQECPRCQALAAHLERMSSLLKDWDRRSGAVEPPAARLRHSVLTRVAEQGARRRREDRLVRSMHWATAACVLLSLGAALFLGLRHDGSGTSAASGLQARVDAPMPLEGWRPTAGLDAALLGPFERYAPQDLLAGVEPLRVPEALPVRRTAAWDAGVWKVVPRDAMALLVDRFRRRDALEARLGLRLMYWNGPSADGADGRPDQPLVTPDALEYLHERGYLQRWMQRSAPRSPTVVAEDLSPLAALESGVRPATVLEPLTAQGETSQPGPASPVVRFHARAAPEAPGAAGEIVHVFDGRALLRAEAAGGLRSGPLAGAADVSVLDPLEAAAQGQLQLRESERGAATVVALVENTRRPIFIPAGQFLTGGLADRVVAHPVWLPASRGRTPHEIACRVVQNFAHGSRDEPVVLQPEIAGPTLRALLAADAPPAQVKGAARELVAAFHGRRDALLGDWSLYSLYAGMHRAAQPVLARLPWDRMQGFVVHDPRGRVVGSELVHLRGPAAAELLRRLWISYTAEAGQRARAPDAAVFARPRAALRVVLQQVAAHGGTLRLPRGLEQSSGTRVSGLGLGPAGVALHALEVGDAPAVVSLLAGR